MTTPSRYPTGTRATCHVCGTEVTLFQGKVLAKHRVKGQKGECAGSRTRPEHARLTHVAPEPPPKPKLTRAQKVRASRDLAAERRQAELDAAEAARAGGGKWRSPDASTRRSGTSVRAASGGAPTLGKRR